MKTVCKKLFSLMLVAALLVSAIPAAFAAEEVKCPDHQDAAVAYRGADLDVAATCTENGSMAYLCAGEVGQSVNNPAAHNFTVVVPMLGHDYEVTTAATCSEKGLKTCSRENCGATEEIPTVDHALTTSVTKEATCGEAGEKLTECSNCEYEVTEPIAATGNHSYKDDGTCSVCGTAGGTVYYTLTFLDEVAGKVETLKVTNGTTITLAMLPDGSLKDGKTFVGWYNNSEKFEAGTVWYAGMPTSFTAKYVDSDDDGVSKLYVYVRFYVKGVQQGYTQLLIDPVEFKDGENMFNWLQNNKGVIGAAIEEKDTEDKYDWYPEYFYNYSGDEVLTAQSLKSNGDQSVVVKAYAEKAAEADVMIYVHTSKTTTPVAIYEMDGKTAGNTVTLAEVKTLLKNKYTVSAGLYSDDAWTDLLNGLSPMAVNGIDVEDNGTLKIHVLATASSSTADSSNPTTGDHITVAATTMVLAAAAFVTLVELKKRKMI